MTCAHAVPVFGCQGCIALDKRRILARAAITTSAPQCPECGGRTVLAETSQEAMVLSYACAAGWTRYGEPVCDGGVDVEVRR